MDDDTLEAARRAAIDADRCFSKGRLRDEFRMKPGKDSHPVRFYKNAYGGRFGVYRIAECVPIQDRPPLPVTEKQARARAILALKAKLRSKQAQTSGIAGTWLAAAPLFLDTESTGLGPDAQIIELAITDASGHVLLETRLRPTVPIEPDAQAVHGIDDQTLSDAPTWPYIARDVEALLCGRMVIIFNDEFDTRLIRQTATAFGERVDWLSAVDVRCAMRLAADAYGTTNRYGTISLTNAAREANVLWPGRAHSAATDAQVTAGVVRAIAGIRATLEQALASL